MRFYCFCGILFNAKKVPTSSQAAHTKKSASFAVIKNEPIDSVRVRFIKCIAAYDV